MSLAKWLPKQWEKRSFLHILLLPISFIFFLLSKIRFLLYRHRFLVTSPLPVPVIVVGNISVGGTGKTPVVIALCEYLKNLGFRPGVISRGYGGTQKQPRLVTSKSDPRQVGDEPVLIAQQTHCPVWVGRDRVRTAQTLLKQHLDCDILISDDGLQHYALQREIEIVLIDGDRLFGNSYLLPAGPLREPITRLETVNSIIINQFRETPHIQALLASLRTPHFKMSLQFVKCYNLQNPSQVMRLEELASYTIRAIAGIGHPERFFNQLKNYGLQLETYAFPDHHSYTRSELDAICAALPQHILLMTEKDAVKCQAFAQPHYWVIQVTPEIEESFYTHFDTQIEKLKPTYTDISVLKN